MLKLTIGAGLQLTSPAPVSHQSRSGKASEWSFKFEMMCILALNNKFVREFDTDNSLTLEAVVDSLDSATSPLVAAKILTTFFDLDVEWDDCECDDAAAIVQLHKVIANLNPSRRKDRSS